MCARAFFFFILFAVRIKSSTNSLKCDGLQSQEEERNCVNNWNNWKDLFSHADLLRCAYREREVLSLQLLGETAGRVYVPEINNLLASRLCMCVCFARHREYLKRILYFLFRCGLITHSIDYIQNYGANTEHLRNGCEWVSHRICNCCTHCSSVHSPVLLLLLLFFKLTNHHNRAKFKCQRGRIYDFITKLSKIKNEYLFVWILNKCKFYGVLKKIREYISSIGQHSDKPKHSEKSIL